MSAVNSLAIDTSLKGILRVALPISVSTFVQFLVVFTDNLFLSRLNESALNAAGNSGIMYIALVMVAVGLSSGVQILTARRKGEQLFQEAAEIFYNSIYLAFIIGVILFIAMNLCRIFLLPHLLNDAVLMSEMDEFLTIRAFGFLVYPVVLSFIGFYSGIAETKVLMYATIIMAVVNLIGDYFLIFGSPYWDGLGLSGAAWASFGAECFALIFVILYTLNKNTIILYKPKVSLWKLPLNHSKKLLKISFPLMGQQFLALATWTSFFFMVEKMGETALYISHLTRTLYFLAFVVVFGIAQTTKTFVSTLIAEKRQDELRPTLIKLIFINVIGVFLFSHGLLLYPEWLLGMFSDDPTVLAQGAKVLNVVFFAILIFAFASVLLNTIEGAGKTQIAFWIELVSIVIYIIFSYLMIFTWKHEIHIVWTMDYLYFGLMGLLSGWFLWKTPWKYNQV